MSGLAVIVPQKPFSIGSTAWSREEMIDFLPKFAEVYARRPIQDNLGGMKSAHLFLFYYAMLKLKPKTVIESGVFKGQGTWLIEQACPDADIICIDINWNNLVYRSEKAAYSSTDFSEQDFAGVDRDTALLFFDDHVNALDRLNQSHAKGFKHALFEDNYFPKWVGDLYTLKMVFSGSGYDAPTSNPRYWGSRLKGSRSDKTVKPNFDDARAAKGMIDVYEELPPIYLPAVNRWGIEAEFTPTPAPLLTEVRTDWQRAFHEEAKWYNWMAYVGLK